MFICYNKFGHYENIYIYICTQLIEIYPTDTLFICFSKFFTYYNHNIIDCVIVLFMLKK